ncbi:MAG TPA: NPCBM/NEW2 domain-containing protein, partial [Micromonosporaceae bacterium]|nr:NPCBM/NEW2 domain-containing protein [Micromonosporaceae bacterium]
YGDGTALFDSGPLTWQQQPVAVDVDIRGRAIVDLVVGDGGDGAAQDSAAWADAHLICVSN